jgi:sirohydrochlorin cobaltochelatase
MFRVIEALKLRPEAAARFPIVEVGFMECNEPSIPEAIDLCVSRGARSIRAVPYFLHTGNHVCEDLPTLLEEAQNRHPDVDFLLGDYIGLSPALTDLLAKRAEVAAGAQ